MTVTLGFCAGALTLVIPGRMANSDGFLRQTLPQKCAELSSVDQKKIVLAAEGYSLFPLELIMGVIFMSLTELSAWGREFAFILNKWLLVASIDLIF